MSHGRAVPCTDVFALLALGGIALLPWLGDHATTDHSDFAGQPWHFHVRGSSETGRHDPLGLRRDPCKTSLRAGARRNVVAFRVVCDFARRGNVLNSVEIRTPSLVSVARTARSSERGPPDTGVFKCQIVQHRRRGAFCSGVAQRRAVVWGRIFVRGRCRARFVVLFAGGFYCFGPCNHGLPLLGLGDRDTVRRVSGCG